MVNKERLLIWLYERANQCRKVYNYRCNQVTNTLWEKEYKPHYTKYAGKRLMDGVETNRYLSQLITDGQPFAVGRFGNTELNFMHQYLKLTLGFTDNRMESAFYSLCNNAGFWGDMHEDAGKYYEVMLKSCAEIDVQGVWLHPDMERYFLRHYEPDSQLMHYVYLEPWACPANDMGVLPWSHSLKGKKVLVIHPFADTIQKQYATKRERIFEKKYSNSDDILPQFELKTIKAVQTIAGTKDERFATWFEALDWMVQECRRVDFDVAIVGCGAYGFPLTAEIKKMGKSAIEICGATQLMFGITGGRWKNNPRFVENYINDAWVEPDAEEKVAGMQKVENACYW